MADDAVVAGVLPAVNELYRWGLTIKGLGVKGLTMNGLNTKGFMQSTHSSRLRLWQHRCIGENIFAEVGMAERETNGFGIVANTCNIDIYSTTIAGCLYR